MDSNEVIDLGREAIHVALLVGGPILFVSLVIGIGIGMLQAMTQVQDQSVSFVPKLMGMLLAVGVALPWLAGKLVDYTQETLATPIIHPFRSNDQAQSPIPTSGRLVSASQRTDQGKSEPENPNSQNSNSNRQQLAEDSEREELTPDKIPFQLPHYRFSRLPKEDQDL
jgi:flagellar biosynthetic protein FliQ